MTKPVAYVINLDCRPDRWQRTQELWSPFFTLVRISAINLPNDGARGCKLSHVSLAERILERRVACQSCQPPESMMIVLEDDAEPTPQMSTIGLQCIDEARKHVSDYDAVNLSPLLDLSAIGLPRADLFRTESPLFLRATYSHSTNAVIYNHSTLPILRDSLTSRLPIDMYIARNAACQWVPSCLLATQSFEDSDIRKKFFGQDNWYADSRAMLEYAALELHPNHV